MYAPAPELTANQVLRAFRHDAPSLLFGAMIMGVGVVAAAFSEIRRKHDPILIYFALFAGLYGQRMWLRTDLLSLAMQGSWFYPRIVYAIDFIVPLPALLFFQAAGLIRRQVKIAGYVLGVVLGSLALATLALGPNQIFYRIANVLS